MTLKIQKTKKDLTKTLQFLSVLGNLFFFSKFYTLYKRTKNQSKINAKNAKITKIYKTLVNLVMVQ